MAAWGEVESWLASEHGVLLRDERSLVIAARTGEEIVRLRAERVSAFDEEWLLILAPIMVEARAQPWDALVFNMRLAIGALAIEQGWLVIRATCPLAVLDRRGLDRHVEFLAREALRLRQLCALGPADGAQTFSHLVE